MIRHLRSVAPLVASLALLCSCASHTIKPGPGLVSVSPAPPTVAKRTSASSPSKR